MQAQDPEQEINRCKYYFKYHLFILGMLFDDYFSKKRVYMKIFRTLKIMIMLKYQIIAKVKKQS